MKTSFVFVSFFLFFSLINCQVLVGYENELTLFQDYNIYWTVQGNIIKFGLSAKSTGKYIQKKI